MAWQPSGSSSPTTILWSGFGVKNMLINEPGFEVVGEAEDGDDAITQTLELEPDILLLDLPCRGFPAWKRCAPSWPSRRGSRLCC